MSTKVLYLLFETREVNNVNYLVVVNTYTEKNIWKKIGNQKRYYSGYFDGEDICIILDGSTCMLDTATAPFKYSEKELREKLLSFDPEKTLYGIPELYPGITFDHDCDNGEILHLVFHCTSAGINNAKLVRITALFGKENVQWFCLAGDYIGYYDRNENIFVKDDTEQPSEYILLQNFPRFTCDIPQLLNKLKQIRKTLLGAKLFEIDISGNNYEIVQGVYREKDNRGEFQSCHNFEPSRERYKFISELCWTDNRDDCNLTDELKTLTDTTRQIQDRDQYTNKKMHANHLTLHYVPHNNTKSREEMEQKCQKLKEKADEIMIKIDNIPEFISRLRAKIAHCDSMIAKSEENPQMEEVD